MSAVLSERRMALLPAKVVAVGAKLFWHCPATGCNKRLGEIAGERVVIRIEKRCYSVSVRSEPELTCFHCHTVSTLEGT